MAELVHERDVSLVDPADLMYDRAYVFAEPGRVTWTAWIEFVSQDGSTILRTDQETSQSNLEGVAYWAMGLEDSYFEGAFDRAWRRTEGRSERTMAKSPRTGGGIAHLELTSVDPMVPLKVMSTRTLVPGLQRRIHNGGVIMYERSRADNGAGTTYELVAQFGSENAAAILANTLWSDLHGMGATLAIEGTEVPLNHSAIKEALLAGQLA
jgi:hypothetical protein